MCGGLPGGCREPTASCFIIATGCMHPALCTEHGEPWKGFSRVSLTPPDFHPWQFGPSDSHLFAGCDFTLTWSFLHSFYHVTLPCSICHEPITRHKPRDFPLFASRVCSQYFCSLFLPSYHLSSFLPLSCSLFFHVLLTWHSSKNRNRHQIMSNQSVDEISGSSVFA